MDPEVIEIHYTDPYDPMDSGNTDDAYFECTEIFTFKNVTPDHTVEIIQNGEILSNYSSSLSDDGTLTITFTGIPVAYGDALTTTVTVTTDAGIARSQSAIAPPSLQEAELIMTPNRDGSHSFTVIAHVDSDGSESMVITAELYTFIDDDPIMLTLSPDADGTYSATYTSVSGTRPVETPFAIVSGYWEKVGSGVYSQTRIAEYSF